MTTLREALPLANLIDHGNDSSWIEREAAAELRRLHALNGELLEALRLTNIDCQYLHHAHKDRHLLFEECPVVARINAAIAKAEGQA